MKNIWLKLIMLVGLMSLLTACGESSALDTSKGTLGVDTQTIEADNSGSNEEVQPEVTSTESNNVDEAVIMMPQEKYDVAIAFMKHGDLPAALEIFNEISEDIDVSKELEICSEYAPYVGFWEADEYDNGYEVINDYLIYVKIPVNPDTGEKKLDIANVGYAWGLEDNKFFNYTDDLYGMELNGTVATKTYEPGYKNISTFDLSTGVYHHDSWSAGSTENIPANGTFVKSDDYESEKYCFYPDTVITTIASVVESVQYVANRSEDDMQSFYFLLSSYNENDNLAKTRFEEYKTYLSTDYELFGNADEIWMKDDVYDTKVTMAIVTYDTFGEQRNDEYFLCVSVSEEKEVIKKVEPAIGMTAKEVLNSTWGEPTKKNITETTGHKHEQWVYYSGKYIYLEDGIVTSIQYSE